MQKQQDVVDWKTRMSTIRQLQNEDGSVPVSLTGWSLSDDEETIELNFQIEHIGESYSEKFEAPKPTNEETLIEELLDNLGYSISTIDLIETDRPEIQAYPVQDSDEWSIKKPYEKSRKDSETHSPPGWAKNSTDDKMGIYFISLFVGFVTGPMLALALYQDHLNQGFTQKTIALTFACSMLNIGTIAYFVGMAMM